MQTQPLDLSLDQALPAWHLSENAAAYFVDRHLSEGRAEKTAFICGDARLTYGDLARQTDRMVGLLTRHGIRHEDRVAMLTLDTLDFPVIFWGAIKAGVIPVALNTLLVTEQYKYILADCRAKALFISAPLLEKVSDILDQLPYLEQVFVVGGDAGDHLSFEAERDASTPGPMCEAHSDEEAFWLYSSGSTGMPKGVRHVHASLRGTADTYGAQVLGIRESDVCYSAAKLFFAYGLGNGMTFPLAAGATVILWPDRPTPQAVFDIFRQHRPSIYFGVPTLYASILAEIPDGGSLPGTDRLRHCVSAGEALPEEVGKRWLALTGVDILDGVGSTEMLHIFLSNQPGNVVYGTSGVPVPGYEVRLVDEHGADVPDGDVGELLVRGDTAAEGYWNKREKSRKTFKGEWTHTGDKYVRNREGRYVYCGRADDMFKVSGIWVSPFEVEGALISHPAVLEAAVVPHEDEQGLTKPKAFVVLKSGTAITDQALKDHVKATVGNWKYPRWIEIVDDLPKTATGKIQRFKLRA